MLGDKNSQRQQQNVHINGGQEAKDRVPCDFYTNDYIADLEKRRSSAQFPKVAALNNEIKKAQTVTFLQHEGRVTSVLCSLLDQESWNCPGPKNLGKRCHLLGPSPASCTVAPLPDNQLDGF